MNKRGVGGHVDWIIGIGLFLVYVALIFAFFKPGIEEVFQSDTLLDIVETNFHMASTWNLTRTPLFLTRLTDYHCWTGAPSPSEVSPDYENRVSYFHLDGLWDGGTFNANAGFVLDVSGSSYELFYVPTADDEDVCVNYVDQYAQDTPLLLNYCESQSPLQRPYSVKFAEDGDLTVPAFFSPNLPETGDSLKYLIVSHPTGESIGGGASSIPDLVSSCDQDDMGNDQNHFLACRIVDAEGNYDSSYAQSPDGESCFAQYSVGVEETLTGMNSDLIDPQPDIVLYLNSHYDFVNTCSSYTGPTESSIYSCIKELWGYPALKEFQIVINYDPDHQDSTPPAMISFPSTPPPYNVRVDSRFYHDFILTPDGLRFPAEVNLLVW